MSADPPAAAMEALAAGVPVVARDLPVLHEVSDDAVRYAGTPHEMAGQILSLLCEHGDPGPGRELAASYTWDAVAEAHVEFYDNL